MGTTTDTELEQHFDTEVKADKLALLYRQSFPAVFLSLSSALLLSVILWPHADRWVLLSWFSALIIASSIRLLLFSAYRKAAPQGLAMLTWERPYLITLLLSSAIWGFGAVWVMPTDSLLFQAVVYYFLMGMAGGAISVYSAIRPFAIATILVVLLPATFWMLSRGELTPVMMGMAAFLLLISAFKATKVLSTALHQSFLLSHELNASKEAAEHLARTDTLTGLNNRRAFIELAEMSLRFCQRHDHQISAIMLDIDHFKRINDNWGHSVGDLALQHIAKILLTTVRKSDICARYGGEEFVVLLPDTDLSEAQMVAEKVRAAIEQQPVETSSGAFPITASCGVASATHSLEDLLSLADKAMYQAKQTGRNQVHSQGAEATAT